ncbi:MAG: hypothetical protein IBX70_13700 [Clostridia bacterium]|nr:hypothetical protein [Clostridia bacterium]
MKKVAIFIALLVVFSNSTYAALVPRVVNMYSLPFNVEKNHPDVLLMGQTIYSAEYSAYKASAEAPRIDIEGTTVTKKNGESEFIEFDDVTSLAMLLKKELLPQETESRVTVLEAERNALIQKLGRESADAFVRHYVAESDLYIERVKRDIASYEYKVAVDNYDQRRLTEFQLMMANYDYELAVASAENAEWTYENALRDLNVSMGLDESLTSYTVNSWVSAEISLEPLDVYLAGALENRLEIVANRIEIDNLTLEKELYEGTRALKYDASTQYDYENILLEIELLRLESEQIQVTIIDEVTKAYNDLILSMERHSGLEQYASEQFPVFESSDLNYKNGWISEVEYLNNEVERMQLEQDLTVSELSILKSFVAFKNLTGSGYLK